jgi:hypothetical protein
MKAMKGVTVEIHLLLDCLASAIRYLWKTRSTVVSVLRAGGNQVTKSVIRIFHAFSDAHVTLDQCGLRKPIGAGCASVDHLVAKLANHTRLIQGWNT